MTLPTLYDFRATTQSPLNGAVDSPIDGIFIISFNHPVEQSTATYDVITYTQTQDSDFIDPLLFDISFSVDGLQIILTPTAPLEPNSEYVVIIRGNDDESQYSLKDRLGFSLRWSFVTRFTTASTAINRPTGLDPSDRSSIEAPVSMTWTASVVKIYNPSTELFDEVDPTRYEVMVATNQSFSNPVYDAFAITNALTIGITLQENIDYFWKVRAQYEVDDSSGSHFISSNWSEVSQFYLGFIVPGDSFTDILGPEAIPYTPPVYSINISDDGIFIPRTSTTHITLVFANDVDETTVNTDNIFLTYRTLPFHRGKPEPLLITVAVEDDGKTITIQNPMGWRDNFIYTIGFADILDTDGNPLIVLDYYSFIFGLNPLLVDWTYIYNYIDTYFVIDNIDLSKLVYSLSLYVVDEYEKYYGSREIPAKYDRWIECFILNGLLADLIYRQVSDPESFSSTGGFSLGDLTIRRSSSSLDIGPATANRYEREAQLCMSNIIPSNNYTVKSWYRQLPPSVADHKRTQYMPESRGWPLFRDYD